MRTEKHCHGKLNIRGNDKNFLKKKMRGFKITFSQSQKKQNA